MEIFPLEHAGKIAADVLGDGGNRRHLPVEHTPPRYALAENPPDMEFRAAIGTETDDLLKDCHGPTKVRLPDLTI
ncbi:hypothetical protein GCM10010836_04480 [Aminobacter aminovorans]